METAVAVVEGEFQQWFETHGDGREDILFMQECHRLKDGAIRVDVSFADDSTFTIICPFGYPHGRNLLFDIRTDHERLKKDWLQKIRAYATENRGQVKLPAILSKCIELHRISASSAGEASASVPKSIPSPQDSDFEDEPGGLGIGSAPNSSDGETEDLICGDDNFTTEWDIQMDFLKKRWLAKEKEMRAQLFAEGKLSSADFPSTSAASASPTSNLGLLASPSTTPKAPSAQAECSESNGPVVNEFGEAFPNESVKQKTWDKIKLLYQSKVKPLPMEEDDWDGQMDPADFDSDYFLHYQAYEGDESSLMTCPKKSRFEDKGTAPKAGQQIFEHESAAFQILSNEMIALLKAAKTESSAGSQRQFDCSALDDSLYRWKVYVNAFPKDHPLSSELVVLKSKFGYDTIELQLDFVPDFPFYPPLLRLVRPRLKGSLVQSLANIDILKLTFWNPAKSVHDVLKQIKDILLKHARLDLDNERNDADKHPEGAYLPLEDQLIKLALATEVRPRANFDVITVENLEKAPQLRSKATSAKETNKPNSGWRAGVGYGHGARSSGWNPESYVIAQQEKDKQILEILKQITKEIEFAAGSCVDEKAAEIFSIIEGSCLLPFLEQQLAVGSFIEIGRHLELYQLMLDVIEAMSKASHLLPLLCNVSRQKFCIMALLGHLQVSAAQCVEYAKPTDRKSKDAGGAVKAKQAKGAKSQAAEDVTEKKLKEDQELANASPAKADLQLLFRKIVDLFAKLTKMVSDAGLKYSSDEQSVEADANAKEDETLVQCYVRLLKPHQFLPIDFSMNGTWAHKYAKNAEDKLSSEVRTIWKEWSALKMGLPINLKSSIFVRYDESHVNLLQALIIGPEDTPYASGCFFFDICFPVSYPSKPPVVTLRTTGGGRVRFNPNLYNCGKVCLSLLGTWSGESGENWNAKTSTLLQVLVSIQSLILVDEPYFNEPGYERTMGTDEGKKSSEKYNKDVRLNCVRYAMLEQLQGPPPGFEEVVRLHYQIKKDAVMKQLDDWVHLDPESNALKTDVEKMKKLMNTLPPPS